MKQRRAAWMWMILLTAVALSAVAIIGSGIPRRAIAVTAWQVTPTTVTETVVCAGTLRSAEGEAVVAEVPCVVKTVEVAVGDAVHIGDTLLTVDREATIRKAQGLGVSSTAVAADALPEAITAPTDGVVTAVHAKAGEWLSASSACIGLSDGGNMEVAITVNESALPEVKIGQAVRVTGVAFKKQGYDGTLTALSSTARSAVGTSGSRTVLDGVVTLDPSQTDASLLGGLSAKAVITVAAREQALVVPYEAVVDREGTRAAVYCLHGGMAYRRAVTVASETANGLEIKSGLQEGEWVVADAAPLTGEEIRVTVEAVACRS